MDPISAYILGRDLRNISSDHDTRFVLPLAHTNGAFSSMATRIPSSNMRGTPSNVTDIQIQIVICLLSGAWAYPQPQSGATASTDSASSDPPGPTLTVKGHAGDGLVPGGPYKCYKTAADFPKNTFPYELIWNTFLPIMKTSNSNKELQDLLSAITKNVYGSDLVDQLAPFCHSEALS